MTLVAILKLGMVLSIVVSLFALALRAKIGDLAYLGTHWRRGIGAFVAMFVIVPVAAILMVRLFEMNRAVEIALIAIAFSPLPPILPGKQLKAGGNACYVTGLLFGATLASIVVAPLGVALVARIFGIDAAITAKDVAMPLAITVLLPIVLGLVLAPVLGGAVDKVSDVARKLGAAVLLVSVLGLLIIVAPARWGLVGDGTLLAFAVIAAIGFGAGYLLGGPNPGDRAALALAASSRHPGAAIAIASHALTDSTLVPAAVLLSMVVSTIVGIPLMRMLDRAEPSA